MCTCPSSRLLIASLVKLKKTLFGETSRLFCGSRASQWTTFQNISPCIAMGLEFIAVHAKRWSSTALTLKILRAIQVLSFTWKIWRGRLNRALLATNSSEIGRLWQVEPSICLMFCKLILHRTDSTKIKLSRLKTKRDLVAMAKVPPSFLSAVSSRKTAKFQCARTISSRIAHLPKVVPSCGPM